LDEAFEVLTLIQIGKTNPIPIVCLETPVGTYWEYMMNFLRSQLVAWGFIHFSDLCLFKVAHLAEEAVNEITTYSPNFHSLRMVGNQMLLRRQRPFSPAQLF